ncbi:restriction endonuclease subunit S [Campylobacter upsaliensis]|nr:restriction endonuclease subunit S [Campylobacter upsaliensis]
MKTDTLKKSLLDYAIKGKLTAKFRRENSELNAFDELEIYNDKIREKRKNLEKELKKCEKEFKLEKDKEQKAFFKSQIQMLKKEIAKCKEITPLNLSEAPFEIPNSWAWVKLGDICEINPKNDISDNVEISFIPMALIADSCQNAFTYELKLWKEVKGGFTHLRDNSVAFAKISPCFENGKSFVVKNLKNGYGAGTTELIVLLPHNPLLKEYVFYCVNSAFFVNQALKTFKGTAGQQRLNMDFVENFTIPLPPLCEQQEIVKKLDLLVTLANDFAITKENLKRIEKRIEKSLLKLALEGSLSKLYRRNSPTLSAFDEINTYNEAIKEKRKDLEKELKKCEKELKLEKDKDKKALFKSQIQMLKKELTKCKEITPLNLSEAPFEIPSTWAWVKLGDICEMKKGPFGSAITKDMFIPNGNNAVKIYEQKNAIQKSETLGEYYISLEHFEKLKQFEVFENDIIVSCAGTIGEIFRIPKNAPKGIINQALMKIKLVNEEWIPYFMIFFDFLIKQKSQENSKGSAIKNIPPLDILKNFSIPLPPLQEQEYITQILDTLFTLKKGLRVD